jgi:hypothetical protein
LVTDEQNPVFDYRALRFLMGFIAFSLPFVVSGIAHNQSLTSISASYHSEARDAFVGLLCIVGAFLWAYNGHSDTQSSLSKVAALAAVLVAFFPTACGSCGNTATTAIHAGAAAVLFGVLSYFCFVPFRVKTKGKPKKRGLRSKIYFTCGWIMVICILIILLSNIFASKEIRFAFRITYWAESVALCAFGFAWIIAGKYFDYFLDEDEDALKIFERNIKN